MMWIFIAFFAVVAFAAAFGWPRMFKGGHTRRLVPYVLQTPRRRRPQPGQDIHVLLCIADHFEPKGGRASPELANSRVERWVRDYPRQFGGFRDSDGRTPRHTFFYPIEE